MIKLNHFKRFKHEILFFDSFLEKNKKRDIRDWYQPASERVRDQTDATNEVLRRGDIPVLHGDCDGRCFLLFRQMSFCFYLFAII